MSASGAISGTRFAPTGATITALPGPSTLTVETPGGPPETKT